MRPVDLLGASIGRGPYWQRNTSLTMDCRQSCDCGGGKRRLGRAGFKPALLAEALV
jgi:hypothetical protein